MDTQSTPARLLHDVLLIVASFADRQSLVRLLTASRALHRDCGRYVFQYPVFLRGDQSILSFLLFMRPYNRKRWRHLDTLCLGHESISPFVAKGFAKRIRYASHLQTLEFEDAEETLPLQTIKHLTIRRGGEIVCRMLEVMQWPLESAFLDNLPIGSCHHDPICDRTHPAILLKNARATLKDLTCYRVRGNDQFFSKYPVYPKLEALSTRNARSYQAVQLVFSYPALKRLDVQTVEGFSCMGEDIMAACDRLRNMKQLATHVRQWDELEYFSGRVVDLYLFGFTCHIRHLRSWLHTSVDTLHFAEVVATARPMHLTLSMSVGHLSPIDLPTYLCVPGLADVKNFEIHVTMCVDVTDGNDGDFDIGAFLGHVLDLLRRAGTRQLVLYLTFRRISSEGDRDLWTNAPKACQSQEPTPLSALETWTKDVDLEALGEHFLEEVASLESVDLRTSLSESSILKAVQLLRETGNSHQGTPL